MLKKYEAPEIVIMKIADIISVSGNVAKDTGSNGIIDGGVIN